LATEQSEERNPEVYDLPIEVLGSCVPWFEGFLRRNGRSVPPGSALALALSRLADLRARAAEPLTFPSASEALRYFQDAHGADFVTKLLHMGVSAGLEIPPNRLAEVLKGDPILTRPGASSLERNRTLEVLLACAVATFTELVRFEEPDVVCKFDSQDFFIPVKVVYSEAKLFQRIKEGVDQAAARPHGGVVVVDVVSLLPTQRLFDLTAATTFSSPSDAGSWLREWSRVWHEQLPLNEWSAAIRRRTTKPIGVAFFLPLVVMVQGLPRTCWLLDMPLRSTKGPDYDFTTGLVQCFDGILGYCPPTVFERGSPPSNEPQGS
jgi:hypothetical protein